MSDQHHDDDGVNVDQSVDDTDTDTATSTQSDPPTTGVQEPIRLHRSRDRRVLAGVAGGIAERFDVNENLIRVIFVILTFFGGLGAAIYLILWVVLRPAGSDPGSSSLREPTPISTSHRLSIAVVASLVVLAGLALAVVHPIHRLGPGLALVWVLFLVALAIIALRTPPRRVTLRRIAGVAVLLGASVIIVIGGTAIGFLESTGVTLAGGNGDHVWQPTSLSQVAHNYHIEFGVGTLDVSAVDFPVGGYTIAASVAAGQLRIVVPADAVVSLSTNVGAGVVLDTPVWIPGVATTDFTPLPVGVGTSTSRKSPHVTIDARVGAGQIDLMRAVSRAG